MCPCTRTHGDRRCRVLRGPPPARLPGARSNAGAAPGSALVVERGRADFVNRLSVSSGSCCPMPCDHHRRADAVVAPITPIAAGTPAGGTTRMTETQSSTDVRDVVAILVSAMANGTALVRCTV